MVGDPTYHITITVEKNGELVERITIDCLDYLRRWTDSPPGFAQGFEFVAPLSGPFRLEIPSAQRGVIEKGTG